MQGLNTGVSNGAIALRVLFELSETISASDKVKYWTSALIQHHCSILHVQLNVSVLHFECASPFKAKLSVNGTLSASNTLETCSFSLS